MNALRVAASANDAKRVVAAMQATPREFVGATAPASAPSRNLPLRIDDAVTYCEFDTARAVASPALPALAASVADLREMLLQHTSDGHGVPLDHVVDVAGDVANLRDVVVRGEVVPAQIEPWARRCAKFWRDGDVLCCTIRVRWQDGVARLLTTCSPVADHVQDVLGDAAAAGVDPLEGLVYMPSIALMKGSGQLLRRLCRAALADPGVRKCAVPCVATIDAEGGVQWA